MPHSSKTPRIFTLGVPQGVGEFVDGIRIESWRLGPPGSVSSLFSHHGHRLPLASETPAGPESPHSDFSLLLGHSQRQGRPRRARSERRRDSKELKEGKGEGNIGRLSLGQQWGHREQVSPQHWRIPSPLPGPALPAAQTGDPGGKTGQNRLIAGC